MSNNIITYIENLNLKKMWFSIETEYIINDNFSILIENSSSTHIFFITNNAKYHKDKYIHIENIEDLKDIYYKKTDKNIELLLRKEKLKKLLSTNEC